MRVFEDRYGVLSRDFYRAMEAGELSDLDDGEEPRFHDFLEWHGLYKIWLKRGSTDEINESVRAVRRQSTDSASRRLL